MSETTKHVAEQFEPPLNVQKNEIKPIDPVDILVPKPEIDWKSKVPVEFLYVNPSRKNIVEKKYGKPIDQLNVIDDKIEDVDLIIKLGGIKHLLKLRGYNSVTYNVIEASKDYAAVNCIIAFTIERSYGSIIYGDNACAHGDNTTSFAKNYLLEIATNRAFCRTVRNFLNINIVSQEEISGSINGNGKEEVDQSKDMVDSTLEKLMKDNSITFEKIKSKLIEENYINKEKNPSLEAKDIKSLSDIDRTKKFILIERVTNKLKEKNK
jgi:hypothetical protein